MIAAGPRLRRADALHILPGTQCETSPAEQRHTRAGPAVLGIPQRCSYNHRLMSTSLSATQIAEAAGFDMSLIRESLGYSYEQRAIQHQAALDLMLEMERAGQKLRDAAQSADRTTLRR
jgi:hypothetical protein